MEDIRIHATPRRTLPRPLNRDHQLPPSPHDEYPANEDRKTGGNVEVTGQLLGCEDLLAEETRECGLIGVMVMAMAQEGRVVVGGTRAGGSCTTGHFLR